MVHNKKTLHDNHYHHGLANDYNYLHHDLIHEQPQNACIYIYLSCSSIANMHRSLPGNATPAFSLRLKESIKQHFALRHLIGPRRTPPLPPISMLAFSHSSIPGIECPSYRPTPLLQTSVEETKNNIGIWGEGGGRKLDDHTNFKKLRRGSNKKANFIRMTALR